jgi:elongation factor Ts
MKNEISVKDNLIDLIAKIGEKIFLRRTIFFDKENGNNYSYVHGAVEKNIGKIASIVKLSKNENSSEVGNKLAMHIAASNPISIDKDGLDAEVISKELEIIKAELLNTGKKKELIEKISKGKLNKFISDNTLLNQVWIMDPKMKVSDMVKNIKILDFIRYKVGEGV